MADAASNPPPISAEEMNDHVGRFEFWFMDRQRAHGLDGAPLTNAEHAIIRSYIVWLHEVGDAPDAPDQNR